jgi:hypothetical protein
MSSVLVDGLLVAGAVEWVGPVAFVLSLEEVVSIGLTVGLGIACLYVWWVGESVREFAFESDAEANTVTRGLWERN